MLRSPLPYHRQRQPFGVAERLRAMVPARGSKTGLKPISARGGINRRRPALLAANAGFRVRVLRPEAIHAARWGGNTQWRGHRGNRSRPCVSSSVWMKRVADSLVGTLCRPTGQRMTGKRPGGASAPCPGLQKVRPWPHAKGSYSETITTSSPSISSAGTAA